MGVKVQMGVEAQLKTKVELGGLRFDQEQVSVARALDQLALQLSNYRPKRSLIGRARHAPHGVYIHGDVGRGKSMLMDMFFEFAPLKQKKRVHFHAFMQDVHKRLQAWRKLSSSKRRRNDNYVRGAGDDPVAPTAKAIARSATLLCFDEFHVTDITDAMILSRLFAALFERGVVVVATSNRAPKNLYKDGLNRDLFIPFIGLLQTRLNIITLDGDIDHRLRKLRKAPIYYTPLGTKSDAAINTIWQRLTRHTTPQTENLHVQGRSIDILAAGGTARANFDELCEIALGAADYLAIAGHFSTLILEHVPIMTADRRNAAKRFVMFVDALYEANTNLVISADAEPDLLYPDGDGHFEFARTVSRLIEMRSHTYLAQDHISQPNL